MVGYRHKHSLVSSETNGMVMLGGLDFTSTTFNALQSCESSILTVYICWCKWLFWRFWCLDFSRFVEEKHSRLKEDLIAALCGKLVSCECRKKFYTRVSSLCVTSLIIRVIFGLKSFVNISLLYFSFNQFLILEWPTTFEWTSIQSM